MSTLCTMTTATLAALTLFLSACGGEPVSGSGGDGGSTASGGGESTTTGGMGGSGGAPIPLPDTWKSGSRLRANLFDGGGGAVLLNSWYDTQLSLNCAFRVTEEGDNRCVPYSASVLYRDSMCTSLAVVSTSGEPAPSYAIESLVGPPDCEFSDPPVRVREVGAKIDAPSIFYDDGAGNCVDGGPFPQYDVYAAGDVVPSSLFAKALKKTAARGDDLEVSLLEVEDGALQTTGIRDPKRDGVCVPFPFGSEIRCAPLPYLAPGLMLGYFADASCTTGVVSFSDPALSCPAPKEALSSSVNGCDVTYLWFTIGEELSVSSIYYSDAGVCKLGGPPDIPGQKYHALGPQEPPGAFPLLGRTNVGTARLRTAEQSAGDGTPLTQIGFFDTLLSDDCYVLFFSDGELRCLPSKTATLAIDNPAYFMDDLCTQEIAFFDGDPVCSAGPPPFVVHYDQFALPQVITAAHEVGEQQVISAYYTLSGGTCQWNDAPGTVVYPVGAEVAFDTFAGISRRTD